MGSGAMWAQNGDPGLGKFELHHFRLLYTHISNIIKKINFSNNKKFTWDNISTHTNTRASALYAILVRTHGQTDKWTDVIITADSYFFNDGANKT